MMFQNYPINISSSYQYGQSYEYGQTYYNGRDNGSYSQSFPRMPEEEDFTYGQEYQQQQYKHSQEKTLLMENMQRRMRQTKGMMSKTSQYQKEQLLEQGRDEEMDRSEGMSEESEEFMELEEGNKQQQKGLKQKRKSKMEQFLEKLNRKEDSFIEDQQDQNNIEEEQEQMYAQNGYYDEKQGDFQQSQQEIQTDTQQKQLPQLQQHIINSHNSNNNKLGNNNNNNKLPRNNHSDGPRKVPRSSANSKPIVISKEEAATLLATATELAKDLASNRHKTLAQIQMEEKEKLAKLLKGQKKPKRKHGDCGDDDGAYTPGSAMIKKKKTLKQKQEEKEKKEKARQLRIALSGGIENSMFQQKSRVFRKPKEKKRHTGKITFGSHVGIRNNKPKGQQQQQQISYREHLYNKYLSTQAAAGGFQGSNSQDKRNENKNQFMGNQHKGSYQNPGSDQQQLSYHKRSRIGNDFPRYPRNSQEQPQQQQYTEYENNSIFANITNNHSLQLNEQDPSRLAYQKMHDGCNVSQLEDTLRSLPKEGHFKYGDIPKIVVSSRVINKEIVLEVAWQARKNGYVPISTMLTTKQVKYYDHGFLLSYYEQRVVKTNKDKMNFLPQEEAEELEKLQGEQIQQEMKQNQQQETLQQQQQLLKQQNLQHSQAKLAGVAQQSSTKQIGVVVGVAKPNGENNDINSIVKQKEIGYQWVIRKGRKVRLNVVSIESDGEDNDDEKQGREQANKSKGKLLTEEDSYQIFMNENQGIDKDIPDKRRNDSECQRNRRTQHDDRRLFSQKQSKKNNEKQMNVVFSVESEEEDQSQENSQSMNQRKFVILEE